MSGELDGAQDLPRGLANSRAPVEVCLMSEGMSKADGDGHGRRAEIPSGCLELARFPFS